MLLNGSRLFSVFACSVGLMTLTACAMFFPSRPISDDIHMKNDESGVEILFCKSGDVEPVVISIGQQRMDGDLLPPSTSPVSVVEGDVVSLSRLTELSEDSERLGPVAAGDQLAISVRLDTGQGAPLVEAQFIVNAEEIDGFAQGLWLTPGGLLQSDPCSV